VPDVFSLLRMSTGTWGDYKLKKYSPGWFYRLPFIRIQNKVILMADETTTTEPPTTTPEAPTPETPTTEATEPTTTTTVVMSFDGEFIICQ
jgi:hypothetical protein